MESSNKVLITGASGGIGSAICDKFNEMSIDGKSFTHIKFFDDDDDYVYWSEAKRKLPPIDEHLTYTLVSEEKFD